MVWECNLYLLSFIQLVPDCPIQVMVMLCSVQALYLWGLQQPIAVTQDTLWLMVPLLVLVFPVDRGVGVHLTAGANHCRVRV